ncbi:MAG: DUF882 domain-containing protein, partial [Pseudomonadota bacterium]
MAGSTRLILALLVLVFFVLFTGVAMAETRKLKMYFLHTGERAEITYKKNGKYIKGGLNKINKFLRDWRRNEPTKMDPRLLDLIWEIYKETGSRKYIHVVSAYRSPATNKLLRKRGRGVAKKSQHTLGKALDFFIPGVGLRKLRNIGLKKGLGGVGYYPKSGSPFVHMDTGRVRHWPRMSRKELVRVFPKGKTLHVPTDGKPLARYNQAKAEYERKIKGGSKIAVASAEEIVKKPSVFARLLGRGEDEEGTIGAVSAPRSVATTKKPAPAAKVEPEQKPKKQPEPEPAIAEPVSPPQLPERSPIAATPEIMLASLPAELLPVPQLAPRPEPVIEETFVAEATAPPIEGDAEADLPPATTVAEAASEREQLAPVAGDDAQPQIEVAKPTVALAAADTGLAIPRPEIGVGSEVPENTTSADAETQLAYAFPVPERSPRIQSFAPEPSEEDPVAATVEAEQAVR